MVINKQKNTNDFESYEEELGHELSNDVTERYKVVPQSFKPQIPEIHFKPQTPETLEEKTEKQLLDFSALLDSLSTLEDRKKALWRQIYENAVTDRKNAYILFGDLYKDVHNNPNEHAIHGVTLAKYMERMEKSNAQLIKLAEMIDEVASMQEEWMADEDTMYDRISSSTKARTKK
jgi:hypothetical protein